MAGIILFPAAAFVLFSLVYFRGFTRTTGMQLRLTNILLYFFASVAITILAYFILSGIKDLAWENLHHIIRTFISPLIEESLKYFTLILLLKLAYPAGEKLQLFRQTVLAGIIVGMGFGLMETYLYIIRQMELLSSIILLGSLPLHMVSAGFLGFAAAVNASRNKRIFYVLIVVTGHIIYNQLLVLPVPLSYISLLILLLGSIALLNLLTAPRDPSSDDV
ncbi:PrsW family glutamic-type intramembrane protease [Salinispira pacifica]|uniref:Protease PrsW n=1 Tax=Salinispira pacifica TaxID=1307761 RepID=V5WH29_9SPIO|nr:PrsW family glutamic-type intramembrane protease [Salinispira pacifica]AHC15088.1 hypothetical protein L21SP2_1705 [Salinispira pacifica]